MYERHPLWQTQFDLEARMVSDGVDQFRNTLAEHISSGDGAATGGGRKVVADLIRPVAEAITAFITAANKPNRVGRRHTAARFIGDMDPNMVAFIAAKTALGQVLFRRSGFSPSVQLVADRVGAAIEAEFHVIKFGRAEPDVVRYILNKLDKTTSHVMHRRRVIVSAMHWKKFEPVRWSKEDRHLVGIKVLDILIGVTNLFEVQPAGFKTPYRLGLSAASTTLLNERNAVAELLRPRLLPCVVPPKPWTRSGRDGGYWTPVTLERSRLVKKSYSAPKPAGPPRPISPTVLTAVNLMQDTAWRVNDRVLDILREVVDRALNDLGVIPKVGDIELPPKPVDIATNKEARREWRHAAADVYSDNLINRSRRKQLICTLGVAEEFRKFDRIYFPYELDFRGRAYASPQWLTPQGPDYAKGLLTFAEGKPIGGGQGPGWLAIHGANSFGLDKVSLEERIIWVEEHEDLITRTAAGPLSELWWTNADSPWQFLAFCFEWSAYRASGSSPDFVSSLPVMVDGTCNGLQHYSAMLRDPVGAAATNLVPADKPSDIYGLVALKVIDTLKQQVGAGHPFAQRWLDFGINRTITKRPVMVLPYGGTFTSCRAYVEEAARDQAKLPFSQEEEREALIYLAHIVWDSMGQVVIAAREAMKWLQAATRAASVAGIEVIRWTTPSGFEAAQNYVEMKSRRLTTAFNGTIKLQFNFEEPTNKLNKRRQGSAVAPNFVHSLDAAAMHLTVETAQANGVTSFAMVHDSYGTVAADIPMLSACLRTEFVLMYSNHNVLEEFANSLLSVSNGNLKLPPLPVMGDLDLSHVLQSDFFFA